MKQFFFMILCVLMAISLSAQDAQIYRKGSSGYVLSVPYTRTEDNEAKKPRDDKKKDDKQDSAAKEKEEVVVVIEDEQAQSAADQGSLEVVIEEEEENIDEEIVEAEEEAAAEEEVAKDLTEDELAIEEEAAQEEENIDEEIVEAEEEATAEEEIAEDLTEDELAIEEDVFEEEADEFIEEAAAPKEPPVKVIEPLRREALEIDGSETVKTATVEEIKNNTKHYSSVILEGQMTLQLGDRAFILIDPTGTLKVELTREAEFYIGDAVLLGSTVRVLGVVKKRIWNDVVIEALKVKVVVPSNITSDLEPVLSDENEYETDDMASEEEIEQAEQAIEEETEEIMADEIENDETEELP